MGKIKNKTLRIWIKFIRSPYSIVYDKWQDCAVRAAALSYYTLAGLISFCVFELWICKVFDIHSYVAEAITTIFGSSGHEVLTQTALDRIETMKKTWAGAAFAVILTSVMFTIDNLSTVFDRILLTDIKAPLFERLIKGLGKAFVATIIIMIGAYLICQLPCPISYMASGILLFILLFLALKFLPTENIFSWGNDVFASLISTVAVMGLFWVIKMIYPYFTGPLGIFLILIWLYFSWLVILTVMLFFSNKSKDGRHSSYKETENIAGMFKTFLSIVVTSFIFKNWQKTRPAGCTFEDIRKNSIAGDCNFPPSTLNRILKRLVKKQVLEVDKDFRYSPHRRLCRRNLEEITVGDILFELRFRGEYDLNDKIAYQSLNVQLSRDLDEYFMQYGKFESLSKKLSEMNFGEVKDDVMGIQKGNWGYYAKRKSYEFIEHPFDTMRGTLFKQAFETDKKELKKQIEGWPEPDRTQGLDEWNRLASLISKEATL